MQHAALDLVELDRFEQRFEIAFAEALVAFALDDLVEHRADHGLGEDLQEQPIGAAIDENLVAREALQILAVTWQTLFHEAVIGIGGVMKSDALAAQRLDSSINVVCR